MNSLKILIFILIKFIKCNENPFHCDLIFSGSNGQFEGIQVFTHWYPIKNGSDFANKLKIYKISLGMEMEIDIEFDENGKAFNLTFDENSVKNISSDVLNRFSVIDYINHWTYECFPRFTVFLIFSYYLFSFN